MMKSTSKNVYSQQAQACGKVRATIWYQKWLEYGNEEVRACGNLHLLWEYLHNPDGIELRGEQAEPMPAWRRRWHQRLLHKAKPPKGQLSKQNRSYPAKGDRKRTYLPQPQLWPQKENKNECPAWELLNRSPRSHASAAGIHRLPTQPSALRAHYSVQSGPDPSCI